MDEAELVNVDTSLLEGVAVSRLEGHPQLACLSIQHATGMVHLHCSARMLNWLADELREQAKRFVN